MFPCALVLPACSCPGWFATRNTEADAKHCQGTQDTFSPTPAPSLQGVCCLSTLLSNRCFPQAPSYSSLSLAVFSGSFQVSHRRFALAFGQALAAEGNEIQTYLTLASGKSSAHRLGSLCSMALCTLVEKSSGDLYLRNDSLLHYSARFGRHPNFA